MRASGKCLLPRLVTVLVTGLVASLVAGLALATSVGAATGLAPGDPHPVQARLLVEQTSIRPDATFDIAVVLDMAPHWHTYWATSGDAGLPTRVTWTLPEGFEASQLQWPGPQRYTEAGDLTVFGYGDQVALFTQVRTPAQLPDTIQAQAQVSWLVCADICIPGDTTLTWTHVRGDAIGDTGVLARYRPLLPTPLTAEDALTWSQTLRRIDGGLRLTVQVQAGHGAGLPDFFAMPPGDTAYLEAGPRIEHEPGAITASFDVMSYAGEQPPERLTGVIGYAGADGTPQYRTITLDLSSPAGEAGFDLLSADFRPASEGSLWIFVLMAMVGGFILNLMPCVLPVISLKVMSLVSQAGSSAARVRQLGLAFSAGIVTTFLALAAVVVALQAGGDQLGWGFQFQSPAFVVLLSGLVFVLGLSLFGVVTVRLPGSGTTLGGLGDGEGPGSSFANGVLATILATPCTAPFLGAALGFAFSQPPATIAVIFLAAGVGMASPYLVLAWNPGWMAWLPKPGAWMERFKQGMGFLLMATVLWLLWILGKQLGMEAVVWSAAFLLCLALAAWVLGAWVDLRSTGRQRAIAWVVAIGLAGAGFVWFVKPLLSSTPAVAAADELSWEAFDVGRIEAQIAEGRTVFIDFTADWCWTCKVNERTVLADADVRRQFTEQNVVMVQADWTSRNPEITELLRAFGRSGVPLYVIFPGGRPEQPLILPEVITPGLVIDYLQQAQSLSRN